MTGRRRALLGVAASAIVLGPLVWLWQASLLPDEYSVMDMGYADEGDAAVAGDGAAGSSTQPGHAGTTGMTGMTGMTGPGGATHAGGTARSVTALVADPSRRADVAVTLVARRQTFRLASGRSIDGYTLNGTSPGPLIRAVAGQLVQVRLVNESVPDGVTLHWHGVDVPNAEDGVAGVTQDAVGVGQEHTYRFVAHQVGTFWYHSHQVSHVQVQRGLFGPLVITSAGPGVDSATSGGHGGHAPGGSGATGQVDVLALTHLYGGVRTVNGQEGEITVTAAPGSPVRVRVVNTDNGQIPVWVAGAPFRLLAVDGTDLTGPTPVTGTYVLVTAGARADLEVAMPADGTPVRVRIAGADVVLGSPADVSPPSTLSSTAPSSVQPATALDLLTYGTPSRLGFDPNRPGRTLRYEIGRGPGFLDGRPGVWWTVNGHLFPDVPMFVVSQGEVVRVHIVNHSGDAHPMHLHGHHAVVLARDGVRATGSPWWVDSLNVADGQSYDITFLADNPGIWMDHCHNLTHAAEGLVAHLAYGGVTTPFRVGGPADNQPE
jgi:FtsP/CotA-like multicopper oxidase with cupredoxin domain